MRLKEITIAIHKVTGLEFPKAKIRVDTTLVILAVILGYILLGSWQWQIVGVGTLFAMVYVGMVVSRYVYGLAKHVKHLYGQE